MPTIIDGIGVIDAAQLLSGAEQGGLVNAARIAAPSSIERRQPVYTHIKAVPDDLKPRVQAAFAQPRCTYSERHLLMLADALVVGQGSVVITDGIRHNIVRDSALEFLCHHLVPESMSRDDDGTFVVNQPVHRYFEDDCLLLQRPWSNNFGHWLVDQAMVLSYLRHIGALNTNRIVVARDVSPRLRETMLQTIDAILPDAIVLEHPASEVWRFRRLHYCMPLHVPAMCKLPAALDCLRQDILAVPVSPEPRPRRIYLVRSGRARKPADEPEIMAMVARHGFEPVSPEKLSIAEQAALFSQAEAVIGVKGAAMTNILFSGPVTSLLVMSPARFTDPFFYDIASTRGVAYSEAFGETTTNFGDNRDEFRIDVGVVEEMIVATLAANALLDVSSEMTISSNPRSI